jgi:hypothetical protein
MAFRTGRQLGFGLFTALLLGACSSKASAPPSVVLNGFERVPDPALAKNLFDPAEALKKPMYPKNDFDLSTSGYATLTPVDKTMARAAKDKALYKFITGKAAGKVRFSVPADYKKKGAENFPKTWESGFSLNIDSQSPLAKTDWSGFKYLALAVYNPGPQVQTLRVRFNDSGSAMTQTSAVAPLGESVLEFPLDILSDARLNASDLKSLTFYLDTAGQDQDPVLIFDEIGLHGLSAEERAKLAQEEGDQGAEEEDWDSGDVETVKQVRVVRPGQTPVADAVAPGQKP